MSAAGFDWVRHADQCASHDNGRCDCARANEAQLQEYSCSKCETRYLQEQECDWCPGQRAMPVSANGTGGAT